MNVITPYEQLLAQEMDHLPLPDSMENIWAEIETQLDVELPPGGGKNPPPRKPAPARRTTPARWTRNWRLFAIVGVVVVTIFLLIPKKRSAINDRNAVPPSKTELPDSLRLRQDTSELYDFITIPASEDSGNKAIKSSGRVNRIDVSNNADNKLPASRPDSPLYIPPPAFIDSAANKPVTPLLINPAPDDKSNKPPGLDSSKANLPGKKRRGVPNIDDSDYRLVPVRKDTPKTGP